MERCHSGARSTSSPHFVSCSMLDLNRLPSASPAKSLQTELLPPQKPGLPCRGRTHVIRLQHISFSKTLTQSYYHLTPVTEVLLFACDWPWRSGIIIGKDRTQHFIVDIPNYTWIHGNTHACTHIPLFEITHLACCCSSSFPMITAFASAADRSRHGCQPSQWMAQLYLISWKEIITISKEQNSVHQLKIRKYLFFFFLGLFQLYVGMSRKGNK